MKELAIFEKYIDLFAITPEIVRESGFNKNPPDFYCLVAEDSQKNGRYFGLLLFAVYGTKQTCHIHKRTLCRRNLQRT